MRYNPLSTSRRDGFAVRVTAFVLAAVVGAQIGWIITLQQELDRSYFQMDRAAEITKDAMTTMALYKQRLDALR